MYNNLDWLITKVKAITKEVTKLGNKFTQYQKKLTAGDNITIENNVISASGGGGGAMIVNVTATMNDGAISLSADKTHAEILSAFLAGNDSVAKLLFEGQVMAAVKLICYLNGLLCFGYGEPDATGEIDFYLECNDQNEWYAPFIG